MKHILLVCAVLWLDWSVGIKYCWPTVVFVFSLQVPIANTDGLDLLNDTLALLHGRVVPLQCLVNLEGHNAPAISHLLETVISELPKETRGDTDKSSEKQKDELSSCQNWSHSTLVYSSALDYYTKNKHTISGHTSSTHFPVFDNPEDKEVKEMNVKLYGSHGKSNPVKLWHKYRYVRGCVHVSYIHI